MKEPGNRDEKAAFGRATFFTRDEGHTQFLRSKSQDLRRCHQERLDCVYIKHVETFRQSLEYRRRQADKWIEADTRRREVLADPTKAADLRDVID